MAAREGQLLGWANDFFYLLYELSQSLVDLFVSYLGLLVPSLEALVALAGAQLCNPNSLKELLVVEEGDPACGGIAPLSS